MLWEVVIGIFHCFVTFDRLNYYRVIEKMIHVLQSQCAPRTRQYTFWPACALISDIALEFVSDVGHKTVFHSSFPYLCFTLIYDCLVGCLISARLKAGGRMNTCIEYINRVRISFKTTATFTIN